MSTERSSSQCLDRGREQSPRIPPPSKVYLATSQPCNLRCVHCDIYKFKNPQGELTAEERDRVVDEVGRWDNTIELVLSGGEPFLFKQRVYRIADRAKNIGISVSLNTNGTLISGTDIERLPCSGIEGLVVSLDSHEEVVHDQMRGVPGTFRRASAVIRALSRSIGKDGFSVSSSSILGAHNLGRIRQLVNYLEELGVAGLTFQPIQANFMGSDDPRWWEKSPLFPRDSNLVLEGIDTLIELKRSGRRLYQSVQEFEDMRAYLLSPNAIPSEMCASGDNNVMVDGVGNVSLCFFSWRLGLPTLGNVREMGLQEMWDASSAGATRALMRRCTFGCGSMACHSRSPSRVFGRLVVFER